MDVPLFVLLCKRDDWSKQAAALAGALFGDRLRTEAGMAGDPLPGVLSDPAALPAPPVILSFLSPWIVPAAVLERAALALNFHPGSCDYPGIGCYNFALYEEAAEYGAVCHHMAARVDTGTLVAERLFPILPQDSVETLKLRTMVTMLDMFHDVATRLATGASLPVGARSWTRRPFTRRELNGLCRVTPDMTAEEIRRRIRATSYPGYPGAVVELAGIPFAVPVAQRRPLA
ncbi:MAG TPA: formyltransferase family protein [Azospirillum sp.]|nr:formyltransferase family protein [Azospirillum sp.]